MAKLRVPRHEVTQPQDQSIKLIALTRGLNAIVDAADYEWLDQWNWTAGKPNPKSGGFYAYRVENGKRVYLHRLLCDANRVDHHNGDTLDFRKENLRPCTATENGGNAKINSRNKSGFKGVSWSQKSKMWTVRVANVYGGDFASKIAAAKAYDAMALKRWGPFARLNFPHENPS